MTIHPTAVVATVVTLVLAVLLTWAVRRALGRRRGGPARNDSAEWSAVFGILCAVLGAIAWLVLTATGPLPHP